MRIALARASKGSRADGEPSLKRARYALTAELRLVSREELHLLVWAEPMTKVSARFDVSGSYLGRICSLLNVPRPERGYWAKLAVGKAPPRMALPDAQPGDPQHWSKEGEAFVPPKPVAPTPRVSQRVVKISRTRIHGLVRGAKAHFDKSRFVEEGAYLKPYKRLLVDVTASQACIDRALDLANGLFNALESVGHRVVMAAANTNLGRGQIEEREAPAKPRDRWEHRGLWSPDRPTLVYVGSVAIGLSIIEMSEHVTLRYVDGKYVREKDYVPPARRHLEGYSWTTARDVPSGRLRVVAYAPYGDVNWSTQWQETATSSLRSMLRSIVAALERAAPDLVNKIEEAGRRAEIARQERLIEHEKWRRHEDQRRIAQSTAESSEQLRQVMAQWADVMSTERFLEGVEQRAARLSEPERLPILQRLTLARQFLGSQDPLEFFLSWRSPAERYQPLRAE
jgi:hypothetical protein